MFQSYYHEYTVLNMFSGPHHPKPSVDAENQHKSCQRLDCFTSSRDLGSRVQTNQVFGELTSSHDCSLFLVFIRDSSFRQTRPFVELQSKHLPELTMVRNLEQLAMTRAPGTRPTGYIYLCWISYFQYDVHVHYVSHRACLVPNFFWKMLL
jgi:hypothetical protein